MMFRGGESMSAGATAENVCVASSKPRPIQASLIQRVPLGDLGDVFASDEGLGDVARTPLDSRDPVGVSFEPHGQLQQDRPDLAAN